MQQSEPERELCSNGCGFFGSSATGGMCSVCWKKTVSNRQAQSAPSNVVMSTSSIVAENDRLDTNDSPSAMPVSTEVHARASSPAENQTPPVDPPVLQRNRKRCWECKKKVGLTGIECRCGFVFCGSHRYSDQHGCQFDYKASERAVLAMRNPGGGAFNKLEKL